MIYRRTFNAVLFFVIWQWMPLQAFASETSNKALVLVTANNKQIEKLQPRTYRKLFLDVPVFSNNAQLLPLINTSDKLLYEIFLQKVVYMSKRNYERTLISNTFRTGRPRPEMYSENPELVKALTSIPNSVSVMWYGNARKEKNIYIVQILWEARH